MANGGYDALRFSSSCGWTRAGVWTPHLTGDELFPMVSHREGETEAASPRRRSRERFPSRSGNILRSDRLSKIARDVSSEGERSGWQIEPPGEGGVVVVANRFEYQ